MIIAVDFDGTLCQNEFPGIGKPIRRNLWFVREAKRRGAKLILWTCRIDDRLSESVEWCRERGVTFDAINAGIPDVVEEWGGVDTRKVCADYYLDDKNLSCRPSIFHLVWVLLRVTLEGRARWAK